MLLDLHGAWGVCVGGFVFVFQNLLSEGVVFHPDEFASFLIEDHCSRNNHEDGRVAVADGFALILGREQAVVSYHVGFFQVKDVIVRIRVAGFHLMLEDALVLVVKQMDVDGSVEIGRRGV